MSSSAHVFKALADPTRREILQLLKDGELAAGEIAAGFEMSGPSISRHLAILVAAGLIRSRRDANRIIYALEPKPLAEALNDFLSNVCPTQIIKRKRAKTGKHRGQS
jgi:DNA-binding transcriptional ArsR family regulator